MALGGKRRSRVLMFAAAGLLCVGAGFGVGRLPALNQLIQAAPVSAVSSQAANHRAAGPALGVSVHGWWTIKVLDRSGRQVSESQFENALSTGFLNGGHALLAGLLTRAYTMGPWELLASWTGGSLKLGSAPDDGNNLTVNGATLGHVILSGNYTATADISITQVSTFGFLCANTIAPSNCTSAFNTYFFGFTGTTLASPVAVANGQIVQLKVDISFS